MWLILDKDKVRGERMSSYLKKTGGQECLVATSETEIPFSSKDGPAVAIVSDGWNQATVEKIKSEFSIAVLLCLPQQVTAERYRSLVLSGYSDIISYPPDAKLVSNWEKKAVTDKKAEDPLQAIIGSKKQKTTYSEIKETVEFLKPEGARKAKVLTFIGVKGGVGKTTLSILFAQTLVSQGKRVVLAEMDPMGTLTTLLKLDKTISTDRFETLPDVLSENELEQNMLRHHSGLWVIPRGERPFGCSSNGAQRLVHLTSQYADTVILDCNVLPLIGTHVALNEADMVYCVTTSDRSSWNEIAPLIHKVKNSSRVILNRVREHRKKAQALKDFLQKEAGFPVAGIVYEDTTLYERVQQGLMIMGSKSTTSAIQDMIKTTFTEEGEL